VLGHVQLLICHRPMLLGLLRKVAETDPAGGEAASFGLSVSCSTTYERRSI